MNSQLIQLTFDKIMQTRSYTVIILGAEEKHFAIYTDPSVGRSIQMFLTEAEKVRPLTHDLMDMIFEGYAIRVKQVVINDVQDTIYYARLFLEQERGDLRHIVEIDARPSDCITLALMNNAPVYCTREVLDKVIPVEE
ncbi:MAG: bifunctional nuclease family protein [Parachlamydiaceae bacterium]|nr:bifunctional nuclease family protein [Parachlamydiaceae bacterium]